MAKANKVTVGGNVIVDMTDATAEAEDVLEGMTAYSATGEKITGTAKTGNVRVFGATCGTAAATQKKDITLTGVTLTAGDVLIVTFTNAQTYNGAPTMSVNGGTAANIRRLTGANAGRYEWQAGETFTLVWNGTYFLIVAGGFATTTYYGRTKLYTGANSTSTGLALTPASLNSLAQSMIAGAPLYSTTATYQVGDLVRYGYLTYRCKTAITTAEAWNAAHWEALPSLQSQIDALPNLTVAELMAL